MRFIVAHDLPLEDVRAVFQSHFPFASARDGEISYENSENGSLLRTRYSKKTGSITSLEIICENIKEVETDIVKSLSKLIIGNSKSVIIRRFIFSFGPIIGRYRFKDIFQISSLPDNAPKPTFTMGDHPLLLEFKCESTGIHFVDQARFDRRFREVFLILSLVCWAKLSGSDNVAAHRWIMHLAEDRIDYQYAQAGYGFYDPSWSPDSFSYDDLPPFRIMPFNDYFNRLGIDSNYEFDVSDLTDELVDKLHSIDRERSKLVFRSIHWLDRARSVWPLSHSLAYVALTSAIETMAMLEPTGSKQEFCPKCDQEIGIRISQKFTDFLHKYAISEDQAFAKDLYNIRSRIIHGNRLLIADIRMWDFAIDKFAEDDKIQQLLRLSKRAIINWLLHNV